MDCQLKQIMQNYVDDFNQANKDALLQDCIVKESIPIIWFGNIEKYFASPVRIVTVALNPSVSEFLDSKGKWLAFPRFDRIDLNNYDDVRLDALYNTLNNYYDGRRSNPYWTYFNQYEKLISVLNASYRANRAENVAIHVDAYSAIATNPTFGKLDKQQQAVLQQRGRPLYQQLVEYLDPDVILISVAQDAFYSICPTCRLRQGKSILKGAYINAYVDGVRPAASSNPRLVLHGRNFKGTPFGGMPVSTAQDNIKWFFDQFKNGKF